MHCFKADENCEGRRSGTKKSAKRKKVKNDCENKLYSFEFQREMLLVSSTVVKFYLCSFGL